MSDYPSSLPNPTVSFSGAVKNATVRTKMDSGRYRQRRRFTQDIRQYKVNWEMTDLQYGLFQAWVAYGISGGADAFYIDLPIGGSEGLQPVLASIVEGAYSASNQGVLHWVVSATLEVDTSVIYSEEEYTALYAIGDLESLEAIAIRLAFLYS